MRAGSARDVALRNAVAGARSRPELSAIFKDFVRAFNVTAYAVGFLPSQGGPPDPFLLLDWPQAWLELYAREGFAREDAAVAAAATAEAAFTWRELQERQPGASARIFAAARGFGWTDGLLIPVRTADAAGPRRLGVASLAATNLDGLGPAGRAALVEASTLAFHHAVALADRQTPATLSQRERQVVALVASGRSDREIAAALGISTPTAHFHVEQAKRKLGAATRAQAVAVAVAQGLLAGG